MRWLLVIFLGLLNVACAPLGDRSHFLIAGDSAGVRHIRAPGHNLGTDLTIELPISASDWNRQDANCTAEYQIRPNVGSEPYSIRAFNLALVRSPVTLVLKGPGIRNGAPGFIADRSLPRRMIDQGNSSNALSDADVDKRFGPFAADLFKFFSACLKTPSKDGGIERGMTAVFSSLPHTLSDELRYQFGIFEWGNPGNPEDDKLVDNALLWAVQLQPGMNLLSSTPIPPPPETPPPPFGGILQSELQLIERYAVVPAHNGKTGSIQRGLDFAGAITLGGVIRDHSIADPQPVYFDGAWSMLHRGSEGAVTATFPLAAYLVYPKSNPTQDNQTGGYWTNFSDPKAQKTATWLVLDYGQTLLSSQNDLLSEHPYKFLLNLRTGDKPAQCERGWNRRMYCFKFTGATIGVARISVFANGRQLWVPVGSLVTDIIQSDPGTNHISSSLCGSSDKKLIDVPWSDGQPPTVLIPKLERRFSFGFSEARYDAPSSLLCAPLLPGDRLSW